jgi:hypothetical protein|tara:strand:- start:2790 stop:3023 length:234 start_codon:yes stop_codon:yes gene_type:complete
MDMWLITICCLSVIGICCYSSYRSGRDEGLQLGIEKSLGILMEQKIIYLDDKSEIYQYDSELAQTARNIDREKYIAK